VSKYTDVEFANKVDWEGGPIPAILDYGLRASDLMSPNKELGIAFAQLQEILLSEEFTSALNELENAIENMEEE